MSDELDEFAGMVEEEEGQQPEGVESDEQATESQGAEHNATPASADAQTGDNGTEAAVEDAEKDLDSIDEQKLSRRDRGLLADAKAERKKRQAIEEKFSRLQNVVEDLERIKARLGTNEDQSDEEKTIFDDPDSWFAQKMAERESVMMSAIDYKMRYQLGRSQMAAEHDDFAQAEEEFDRLVGPNGSNNPGLAREVISHQNPAQFVYDYVKMSELNDAHGGPASLQKKVAELQAEVERLRQGSRQNESQDMPVIPRSQAGARNVGGSAPATGDSDPFDLDKIGASW